MRYGTKWPEYAKQWDAMQIKPLRQKEMEAYAKFAVDHKAQYKAIEDKTGVPWPLIAVLHRRESDADFNTYLGNGDRLSRRTVHVPAGRGPFLGPDAFVYGAVDALRIDRLDKVIDWRLEKMLYFCEIFNGTGYDRHGRPSPYNWGGTNIQVPGKYVRDGVYDSSVWDGQPGCAPILKMIQEFDPSVEYIRET